VSAGAPSNGQLKIAMLCPYSLARPGGVQSQVRGLAHSLGAAGHEVRIVAPDDDHRVGDRYVDEQGNGVFVVGHSVGLHSNGSVAPVSLSPTAVFRTERFLRDEHFDVAHVHEPMAPVVGYGALLARLPLVATYHRSGGSGWYAALGWAARWGSGRIGAHCAVSEAARRTAAAVMPASYSVLFNGIDVERFASAVPSPREGPTVLFLGRHEERKGLEVLLRAFGALEQPARLWVAGDGPETTALRQRYGELQGLEWLGVISDHEVAARVAGADVLCAPSLGGESFGLVLLEAMAARTVVVASDIEGYREAAAGFAHLVAPGDPGALARSLDDALSEVGRAEGRGATESLDAALGHARHWSMDALAERYVAFYRQVIADFGAKRAK
jgi:phosphatidylinositol alpha-mannosyltransferase